MDAVTVFSRYFTRRSAEACAERCRDHIAWRVLTEMRLVGREWRTPAFAATEVVVREVGPEL